MAQADRFLSEFSFCDVWAFVSVITHSVISLFAPPPWLPSCAAQGQWGVKLREDRPALGCTAPRLLPSSPRAPAPSPTARQLQPPLHTALIPPLTTANTTRPTHRYCSMYMHYTEIRNITIMHVWKFVCSIVLSDTWPKMWKRELLAGWMIDGRIFNEWMDECSNDRVSCNYGRQKMRMGMNI